MVLAHLYFPKIAQNLLNCLNQAYYGSNFQKFYLILEKSFLCASCFYRKLRESILGKSKSYINAYRYVANIFKFQKLVGVNLLFCSKLGLYTSLYQISLKSHACNHATKV